MSDYMKTHFGKAVYNFAMATNWSNCLDFIQLPDVNSGPIMTLACLTQDLVTNVSSTLLSACYETLAAGGPSPRYVPCGSKFDFNLIYGQNATGGFQCGVVTWGSWYYSSDPNECAVATLDQRFPVVPPATPNDISSTIYAVAIAVGFGLTAAGVAGVAFFKRRHQRREQAQELGFMQVPQQFTA